jgi:hypothetical protein
MKGTVREKFGKLQERYGSSRERAQKNMDNWLQGRHETETPRTRTSGGGAQH